MKQYKKKMPNRSELVSRICKLTNIRPKTIRQGYLGREELVKLLCILEKLTEKADVCNMNDSTTKI